MSSEARPVEVCYIEDHPGDIRLMAEALEETQPSCRLRAFPSLEPALKALIEDKNLRPDLIVVDGGLFDEDSPLLKLVRMTPALARTPVVMFSGSPRPRIALQEVWDRWVQKPSGLQAYFAAVRDMLMLLPSH